MASECVATAPVQLSTQSVSAFVHTGAVARACGSVWFAQQQRVGSDSNELLRQCCSLTPLKAISRQAVFSLHFTPAHCVASSGSWWEQCCTPCSCV